MVYGGWQMCVQVPVEEAFVWPNARLCVKRFLVLN